MKKEHSTGILKHASTFIEKFEKHNATFLSKAAAQNEDEYTKFKYFDMVMDKITQFFNITSDSELSVKKNMREFNLKKLNDSNITVDDFIKTIHNLDEYKNDDYLHGSDSVLYSLLRYTNFNELIFLSVFKTIRKSHKFKPTEVKKIMMSNIIIQLEGFTADVGLLPSPSCLDPKTQSGSLALDKMVSTIIRLRKLEDIAIHGKSPIISNYVFGAKSALNMFRLLKQGLPESAKSEIIDAYSQVVNHIAYDSTWNLIEEYFFQCNYASHTKKSTKQIF